ncbi:hypothetical protein LOK49_LG06G00618 [Camellia lanceoleosa]|uniref:Uncharacterized protein n=1 Tax=Camellia lanceoleosa TaxID=1840588 RepID=A0ACC0HAH9_9ERIC|nr:hypothetical protein LOK49_LG06G00618 [Camellia lanceoleosa]
MATLKGSDKASIAAVLRDSQGSILDGLTQSIITVQLMPILVENFMLEAFLMGNLQDLCFAATDCESGLYCGQAIKPILFFLTHTLRPLAVSVISTVEILPQ